ERHPRDSYLIVKLPCMIDLCGSQTNLYVPFFNVIVNVFVPVPETLVLTLTPGPVRWKSWIDDLSLTTSMIFPGFVGFFAIEMVKPGPTVPLKTGIAAEAGNAATSATTARLTTARPVSRKRGRMSLLRCGLADTPDCTVIPVDRFRQT